MMKRSDSIGKRATGPFGLLAPLAPQSDEVVRSSKCDDNRFDSLEKEELKREQIKERRQKPCNSSKNTS